jgi:hypothetical protein
MGQSLVCCQHFHLPLTSLNAAAGAAADGSGLELDIKQPQQPPRPQQQQHRPIHDPTIDVKCNRLTWKARDRILRAAAANPSESFALYVSCKLTDIGNVHLTGDMLVLSTDAHKPLCRFMKLRNPGAFAAKLAIAIERVRQQQGRRQVPLPPRQRQRQPPRPRAAAARNGEPGDDDDGNGGGTEGRVQPTVQVYQPGNSDAAAAEKPDARSAVRT